MINSKTANLITVVLYLSIIIGFWINEDTLGGAFYDYKTLNHISYKFSNNFFFTLQNYDDLNHRQSPTFYILKSFISKFDENFQRLFFLHVFLLIPIFFYKCLKIVFKKTNKSKLKTIAFLILLFPTFRSYSIWPDPHLMGFLFFLISIYYFIKFKYKAETLKYAILNTIFLSMSAYFSPNFGVFVLYFIVQFYLIFKFSLKIFVLLLINLFLSLPFLYYLFVLDVDFIFQNSNWDIGDNFYSLNNISNKFIIILSLIGFYLIPFLFSFKINFNNSLILKNKFYHFVSIIIFFVFLLNFEFSEVYNLTNSGGGFIYNLSQFLLNNNLLLFFFSFLTLLYLNKNFLNNNNIILFIVLILSNPQSTIWQANFSPTIFVLFFLLFDLKFDREKINNKFILLQYVYYLTYFIANFVYKYDIKSLI